MARRKIKEGIKEKKAEDEINRLRCNLRSDLRKWRAAQRIVMPTIAAFIDDSVCLLEDVENETLFLPSYFDAEQREEFELHDLARIEMRLREGEAGDAIIKLQTALRKIAEFDSTRYKRVGATSKHTRRQTEVNKAHDTKRKLSAKYSEARKAMLRLGLPESSKDFPPLNPEDLFRPTTSEPHEFGSGTKKVGWVIMFGMESVEEKDVSEWDKDGELILRLFISMV